MNESVKLRPRRVEKPWGRDDLAAGFGPTDGRKIGEIWFEPDDPLPQPLLAKYLFTSERLSVQVHPGAPHAPDFARCAKNECWYVVASEEGAEIGLGLSEACSAEQLREAALDGSIERQLDWRPVRAGDFIYVPAGTIHSIGAGLTIVELQQNCDITYRLFDFGRPRELQLDAALAVARLEASDPSHFLPASGGNEDRMLIDVPEFAIARVSGPEAAGWLADRTRWILPIRGSASADGTMVSPGDCLLAAPDAKIDLGPEALLLVAAVSTSGALLSKHGR